MASKVTLNGELMFPNEYISAPELKERDVALTIASVTSEMLKAKKGADKKALVMRFNGTTKKLVVNKTNADTIATLHGPKAELWPGKRITLYPTHCMAFGERVECIRIREKNSGPTTSRKLPDPPPPDAFDEPPNNAPGAGDGIDQESAPLVDDSNGAGADIGQDDDANQPQAPEEDSQEPPPTLPNPCTQAQITTLLMLLAPEGMDSKDAVNLITAYLNVKLAKKWDRLTRESQETYFKTWTTKGFPPFYAV